MFKNNVLLENSNLCPQSHYGNLRDVFTLENIHVVHTIFRYCMYLGHSFFPKQCKKENFLASTIIAHPGATAT